jgi:hypothetical protein
MQCHGNCHILGFVQKIGQFALCGSSGGGDVSVSESVSVVLHRRIQMTGIKDDVGGNCAGLLRVGGQPFR